MRQWLCVDDFIFQAAPPAVPRLVAEYERICSIDGILRVREKCKAYWPSYAQARRGGGDTEQRWLATQQMQLSAIIGAVRVTTEHITVLGNALGGDYAVDLATGADGTTHVNQSHNSPLAARSRRASKLARGLRAMAETQLAAGGKQPAWTIMRDCLANALSYDARVCEVTHYRSFAEQLRDEISGVAGAIAGIELQPVHAMQLFMRREEGGMDVHDPVASGARARAAAVVERGPDLRTRLRELFPDAQPVAYNAAEGIKDAPDLLHEMREQGIAIGPYGLPQRVGIIPQNAAEV